MGRRSTHKPEELKDLIIRTALSVIEQEGIGGLSARTIAGQIGYSPGTLYNLFKNLDALVFHVEVRILDDLTSQLMTAQTGVAPEARLRRVAFAYLAFAEDRPRAWSLLFEHFVDSPAAVPGSYTDRLELVVKVIEHAIRSGSGSEDNEALQRAARLAFCTLTGISAMAVSPKLVRIGHDDAQRMIEQFLIEHMRYWSGFGAADRHAEDGSQHR
ncbi:MAG: TetR/AcrR family transcriptional regulator [Hyphomicrobiaceae bacterium]